MGRPTGPAAMGGAARRRWPLLLPWVVAAGLLAATWVAGGRTTTRGSAASSTAPAGPAAELALPARVEIDVRTATRRALGWHGLTGDDGPDDRWVVDQALEDVRPLADGVAEVVVRASVIVRADERWEGPLPATVVVPLTTTPLLAVAGPGRVLDDPVTAPDDQTAPAGSRDGPSPSLPDDRADSPTAPGADR